MVCYLCISSYSFFIVLFLKPIYFIYAITVYLRLFASLKLEARPPCTNFSRYLRTTLWYRNTAYVSRSESLKSLRIAALTVAVLLSGHFLSFFFLSLDLHHVQFTNVPLSEYCVGEFPQLDFSLFLLSSCSFLYLNLNLVALRMSAFFFFILLHMLKPAVFDYSEYSVLSVKILYLYFVSCVQRFLFFFILRLIFFRLILRAQDVSRCLSKSLFYRLSIS